MLVAGTRKIHLKMSILYQLQRKALQISQKCGAQSTPGYSKRPMFKTERHFGRKVADTNKSGKERIYGHTCKMLPSLLHLCNSYIVHGDQR